VPSDKQGTWIITHAPCCEGTKINITVSRYGLLASGVCDPDEFDITLARIVRSLQ
jgi:hypothetical protein